MTKIIIEPSKGNTLGSYTIFDRPGTIRFYLTNENNPNRYMGFKKNNRKHIKEVESWLREGYKVIFNVK